MKRFLKPAAVLALTVVLVVTLVGCGSSTSSIVGRWNKTEGSGFSYLEFFSDGTYTSSHVNYEGNYSIDGDRLKLSGILVEAKTYTFEIKGDTLSLYTSSESDSPTAVYEKD